MHLATGFSIPDLASIELVKAHDRKMDPMPTMPRTYRSARLFLTNKLNSYDSLYDNMPTPPSAKSANRNNHPPPSVLSLYSQQDKPYRRSHRHRQVSPSRRSARLIIPHGKWTLRLTSKLPLNPIKHFLSDLLNAAFHSMVRIERRPYE